MGCAFFCSLLALVRCSCHIAGASFLAQLTGKKNGRRSRLRRDRLVVEMPNRAHFFGILRYSDREEAPDRSSSVPSVASERIPGAKSGPYVSRNVPTRVSLRLRRISPSRSWHRSSSTGRHSFALSDISFLLSPTSASPPTGLIIHRCKIFSPLAMLIKSVYISMNGRQRNN